jgi:hypothetical protein
LKVKLPGKKLPVKEVDCVETSDMAKKAGRDRKIFSPMSINIAGENEKLRNAFDPAIASNPNVKAGDAINDPIGGILVSEVGGAGPDIAVVETVSSD